MPIIQSSKKALRQNLKRRVVNKQKKSAIKTAFKIAKKTKSKKDISAFYSIVDKAVKTHIFHRNKASRIKSQVAKLVSK